MLIRQPKHHLPIRRRTHIIPRIPLHYGRSSFTGKPAHGFDLFRLDLDLPLCIPDDGVAVAAGAADEVAAVGAEADVALAQRAGGAGRGAEVRGGVV